MTLTLKKQISTLALLFAAIGFTLSTSPAFAAKCGGLNKRPCKVWERIPSCNKGLVENLKINRCVRHKIPKKRLKCGKLNQRPCTVVERIPSCDRGLVENFKLKRCVRQKKVVCGGVNQRPCKVFERIPSCNKGLGENFKTNRCVQLRSDQSAFFYGLSSASREVANLEKICHSVANKLPPIRTGIAAFDRSAGCQMQYQIGFRCAAPMVFEKVAQSSNLAGRIDTAMNNRECRKAPGPLKPFCALGSVIDQAAIRPAVCLAKVMANGGFQDVAAGSSVALGSLCRAAGRLSFEIALDRLLKRRNNLKGYKRTLFNAAKKARKYSKKVTKMERFFQKLEREPACRGVLN